MEQFEILLIGDVCVDVYNYGTVNRISPEAPVPILDVERTEKKMGMSANVADNIKALNYKVTHLTGNETSIKTRFIDSKTGQQMLRVDEDKMSYPVNVFGLPNQPSCIVLSDYGKGTLDYTTIEQIIDKFTCPIFIDTKKTDLGQFDRIYPPREVFFKINEVENSNLNSTCRNTIVTLGKRGATFIGKDFPAPHVNVADVCGAGDTFLAALACSYMTNRDIEKAIEFAIEASSITVQHLGVYAPTLGEIDAIRRQS